VAVQPLLVLERFLELQELHRKATQVALAQQIMRPIVLQVVAVALAQSAVMAAHQHLT
jgi:hypothetical protein